jgi:hypothetical protein
MATDFARDLVRWAKVLGQERGEKWNALVAAASIFQSGDFAMRGCSPADVARKWIEEDLEGCRHWMS